MFGAPPNCRPECLIHADCPTRLACLQNKCRDPCTGSCGFNAKCTVVNHQPICSCEPGYQGDPFNGCNLLPGLYNIDFFLFNLVVLFLSGTEYIKLIGNFNKLYADCIIKTILLIL